MELRQLRYFVAVAEELHFKRAAERLHIEQSPLSRAIKELEYKLGVRLFERTTRNTRITRAGQILLEEARRLLASVKETQRNVAAAANGFHGHLRVGVCDGITQPRLAALLACSREEEPGLEVRVYERSFVQQLADLRNDEIDVAFALSNDVGSDLVAEPVWTDPLVALLPAGHRLAQNMRVELDDVLAQPLILCHPDMGSGSTRQIDALLKATGMKPLIADYVNTLGVMLTLVGAGYGIGFALGTHTATLRRPDVVVRSFEKKPMLTTYVLRGARELSEALACFVERSTGFAKSLR